MTTASTLRAIRTVHRYLGVFITPALIFFAFTGALQTFGLHETNRDHPTYKPAHWIAVLAQLHKKQTVILPARRPSSAPVASPSGTTPETHRAKAPDTPAAPAVPSAPAAPAVPSAPAAPAAPQPTPHPLPMRIFFLAVCLGLFTSTLTGLCMTYNYLRNKLLVTLTLTAGIVVPLVLVFI